MGNSGAATERLRGTMKAVGVTGKKAEVDGGKNRKSHTFLLADIAFLFTGGWKCGWG